MRATGIKTELNTNGTVKNYIFNAKQYGEKLKPILEEAGFIDEEKENEKFLAGKKFYSVNEAIEETIKRAKEKCRKEGLL
ncbi:MAG: hypothetical protein KF900_07050 [Bacteroidetes bacterium]|nr:hypothetical protein [Bacteroidota bacterium]